MDKALLSQLAIEYDQIPAGLQTLLTENIQKDDEDGSLHRRTLTLLPDDACACEDLSAHIHKEKLKIQHNHTCTVIAIDRNNEDGTWRLETVGPGINVKARQYRNALNYYAERTRVEVLFDPRQGRLLDCIQIAGERKWAKTSSLLVNENGGRSGLDVAWVSSAIGMSCFGEAASKSSLPEEGMDSKVSLPWAGLDLVFAPHFFQVEFTCSSTDESRGWILRRAFDKLCDSCEVSEV